MLKLKSLRFQNIGRFVEKQSIDFTYLGNLIQVDAVNSNTNGSSGSGKTTVFNALEYLLGINDIPTNVLQSRCTDEGISVSGNFDWDNKNIWITRSKSRGLAIELPDDIVISGSNKLSEEKLDEIIGMPRHLFRKVLHKRQKESGFFLEFTPKQIHDFLIDCLGLSEYRSKIETIDNRIKELDEELNVLSKDNIGTESAISATKDVLSLLLEPIADITKEKILELKALMNQSKISLEDMQSREAIELQLCIAPKVSIVHFNKDILKNLQNQRQTLLDEFVAIDRIESERNKQITSKIYQLQQNKFVLEKTVSDGQDAHKRAIKTVISIQKLEGSICPTCEQDWKDELSKKQLDSLISELKDLNSLMDKGNVAEIELKDLKINIISLETDSKADPEILDKRNNISNNIKLVDEKIEKEEFKEKQHNNEESEKHNKVLKEYTDKQDEIRERYFSIIKQLRDTLNKDSIAFESAVTKFKSFAQERKKYEENFQALSDKLSIFNIKYKELSNKIKDINEKRSLLEESKRAIKSFINHSFDNALESIGETATSIIRHIPNMANATIYLDAVRETKEGKVKEEVSPIISMDGDLNIPIKSLSGGERTSADIAIDLAVIDFIESKTGKGSDLFIMDEPFGGLGAVEIEMILEMLKNNNNKKIVIVDHNSLVKEMVSDIILVSRTGNTSFIEKR